MQPIPTFWLEPTREVGRGLRRYSSRGEGFTCDTGFHDALCYLRIAPATFTTRGTLAALPPTPHTAIGWPLHCSRCDYEFTDDDYWQDWQELIYTTTPAPSVAPSLYVLHANAPAPELDIPSAPPGAMWDSPWLPDSFLQPPYPETPDIRCVTVRTPNNHDWQVDTQASNCTRPDEPHHCWVRHNDPRNPHGSATRPPFTVDKNGDTCAAGGGSILTPSWHGFLTNGFLVTV